MSFTVTMHHGSAYLLIVGTGSASLGDLVNAISVAARLCDERAYTRILFDFIAVEPVVSKDELSALGSHAAAMLSNVMKISVVVDSRFRDGVGEERARAGGLGLKVFTNLVAATEWIARDA